MKTIKSFLCRVFAPQKRPTEGTRTLLFTMGIYVLLLIWAILFKFSFISEINMEASVTLKERFLNGFHFFDFVLESNRWLQIRGFLVAILNILLFMPWGIYASFFYGAKRTVLFACFFSSLVECIQLFANFGVFSFEDVLLNTLGAVIGFWLYQKYINRISQATTQKINWLTVRIGAPFAAVAYVSVIVAMIIHFS